MKNSNLLNRLLSYSHEKQSPQHFARYAVMLIMLLTLGVGQMWADTYKLTYKKDMGSGDYNTGTTYHEMTQCPDNSNIYYFSADLEAGTYGFFLQKNSSNYFKADATITDYSKVELFDYGSNNYGNSSHRITYTASSAGTYVFTYDANDKKVYVSPVSSQSIKLYHGQSTEHDSWHDLPNNVSLTEIGTSEEYYADLVLTGGVKKYVYIRAGADSKYFKGTSTLTVDNTVTVYFYDGNNVDKVNFTPSASDTYRFTWNHIKKTIKVNRVFNVSFDGNGSTSGAMTAQTILSGTATALTANSFSKSNYTFVGWNTQADGSGASYTNEQAVTLNASTGSDLTLYAQWKQTIILNDNNGGSNNGSVEAIYNNAGPFTPITAPTKTGYHVIDGYYAEGGCTNKVLTTTGALVNYAGYVEGDKWVRSSATTLYAKWTANTYIVDFDANGGEGDIADQDFTYNVAQNLTSNTTQIKRNGYFFDGWATTPGGERTYTNGQSVSNLTTENGGTVTLYAHWVHVPTLSTVTATPEEYNYQGEDITLNLSVTSTYQTTPAVKFFVNDGISTTIVTADAGDVGSAPTYTTTHTATFTITDSRTYHVTAKLYNDPASETPVKDEKDVDVTKAADDVVINQTYDITIVGGRESSVSDKTTVKASANVDNALAGTAYVSVLDIPIGKKFTKWNLSTGLSLKEGSSITDQSIEFYADGIGTVTAVYEDRASILIGFDSVPGWTNTSVFIWEKDNASNCNVAYPGDRMTTSTTYDGVKCFIYSFYTEGNGISAFDANKAKWNRISFNNRPAGDAVIYDDPGWNQTRDFVLADYHYYHYADVAGSSGSPYYFDWYVMGKWNGSSTWNYTNPIDWSNSATIRDLTNGTKQEFKIYRASTGEWFRYTTSNTIPLGTEMTLSATGGANNDFIPDESAGYKFTLKKDDTNPKLTVEKLADSDVAVTVEAGANGTITTGPSTIHVYTSTTIAASANAGYRFKKWTVDDAHKNYIQIADTNSATTTVYAKYASLGADATITAQFSNENMIYCDASAVYDTWSLSSNKLYVCLYSSAYWNNDRGTGASGSQCFVKTAEMTQIGSSKVYYYDYSGSGHKDGSDGNPDFNYVAFINKYLPSAGDFADASVTYRGDFYPSAGRLYVIERTTPVMKNTTAAYYNEGFWMKYREEEAGIKLKIYDGSNQQLYGSPFTFTRENLDVRTFTTTMKLNGSSEYRMELLDDNGIYYKNRGHMYTDNCTNWQFTEREKTVGYINTSGEGNYTFTLDCGNTTAGQMKMSATYPLHAGDYRIVYNGKTNTEAVSAGEFIGPTIKKWTSGTQKDTVSFFVVDRKDAGMDWNFDIQSCSIDGSTVTWNDVAGKTGITIPALNGDTGVYVFDVTQTSASDITISDPVLYEGDYYIRTDIAEGRWEAYKEAADNKLVHSDWAKAHSGYDYYHCHYTPNGKSVKFTVANDYSSSISGELTTDSYTDSNAKLTANANVRFSYNSATNVIKRAYIGGSSENDYLNIVSPVEDYVFTSGGTDLYDASAATRKFVDMGNWVYQMDIQAYPTATAKVTADFKGSTQYFVGTESTAETILGGDKKGDKKYNLRAVYDFKNNHLITSWLADGTRIEDKLSLNADLMIVRHLQDQAAQITFSTGNSLSEVKTIYGAIRCDYSEMVNQMPNWSAPGIYGKLIYYISFPFDVNVKDIFGSAGNMEDQWIIQTYNGARRATEGWFADSKPFWETLTVDSVMHANQGYVLILDRPSFNSASSIVWENKTSSSSVYLYFPSADTDVKTISNGEQTIHVPAHKCEIKRSFLNSRSEWVSHEITDSHWNMIGTPLFESNRANAVSIKDGETLNYLYDWNSSTNNYTIEAVNTSYNFKSMHGYMVQFAGDVTFSGATLETPTPAEIAARRAQDNRDFLIKLQMTNETDAESHTFVELRENACDTFALNEDMYMMRSSNIVDVYTYAGNYDVAANVLSVSNHTIPVGLDVKKADTYTFSMPSNFSGSVTLVDQVANTRTNLAMDDYQVYLNQGAIEGRFYLELNINNAPTAIDGVEDSEGILKDGKAHKFLQNGAMYILKDGVIYDARGNRVK